MFIISFREIGPCFLYMISYKLKYGGPGACPRSHELKIDPPPPVASQGFQLFIYILTTRLL